MLAESSFAKQYKMHIEPNVPKAARQYVPYLAVAGAVLAASPVILTLGFLAAITSPVRN